MTMNLHDLDALAADLEWTEKHNTMDLDDDHYPAVFHIGESGDIEVTHEQLTALFRKWKQAKSGDRPDETPDWLAFCRTVHPTFGMNNAVTVQWCGMWLAIETDGYTHS